MAELSKWAPSDMLEPIKRFLDGELAVTSSMKVEQFQDGTPWWSGRRCPGSIPTGTSTSP